MLPAVVRRNPTLLDVAEGIELVDQTGIDLEERQATTPKRSARRWPAFRLDVVVRKPPPPDAFGNRDERAVRAERRSLDEVALTGRVTGILERLRGFSLECDEVDAALGLVPPEHRGAVAARREGNVGVAASPRLYDALADEATLGPGAKLEVIAVSSREQRHCRSVLRPPNRVGPRPPDKLAGLQIPHAALPLEDVRHLGGNQAS